jgi:hypothetical protein
MPSSSDWHRTPNTLARTTVSEYVRIAKLEARLRERGRERRA